MTLQEIIEQLESCHYECEAGPLENNVAWIELKQLMKRPDGEKLREGLAEYAHEAWSGWMKYLFSKCERDVLVTDSGLVMRCIIPKWAVDRWQRQMTTSYADLPNDEKESDRLEADRMIEVWDRTPTEQ